MTNMEALNAGGPTAWAKLLFGYTKETYSEEYQQKCWWAPFDNEGHMGLLVKELRPILKVIVNLNPYEGDYELNGDNVEDIRTGVDILWESIQHLQEEVAFITWLGYEFNPEKSQWLKELIEK